MIHSETRVVWTVSLVAGRGGGAGRIHWTASGDCGGDWGSSLSRWLGLASPGLPLGLPLGVPFGLLDSARMADDMDRAGLATAMMSAPLEAITCDTEKGE